MRRVLGTITEDVLLRAVVLMVGMSLYLGVLLLALAVARLVG